MTEAGQATYRRVDELLRSGMPKQAAFKLVADKEGITASAVGQRFYTNRPDRPAPTPQRRRTDPGEPEPSLGDLIEMAAALVLQAAREARGVEEDAARWRQVSAILDAGR